MKLIRAIILVFTIVLFHSSGWTCTIFSAKDKAGNVWAGNNEDKADFRFDIQMKITPKTDSTYGYFYFRSPINLLPQGGVNEAGLFFDFNAVTSIPGTTGINKTPFPGNVGIEIILHMLGKCESVPEAIELYRKHYSSLFKKAQMHVADRFGNLGLILPDTAYITSKNFHVSTNFNLCAETLNTRGCWRYPVANSMLSSSEPGFELFTSICNSTCQRGRYNTYYSNIHNLNTGEMQIFYGWNYSDPYVTTIEELMALGDTLILMRDLFQSNPLVKSYHAFLDKDFIAAMEVLNQISDSVSRQERIKLLELDILFGTTKDRLTNDLIHQMIESTNNELILAFLSKKSTLKKNRLYAKKKLKTITNVRSNGGIINWVVALFLFLGVIFFIIKRNKP